MDNDKIGLERWVVRLVDHQESWSEIFEDEKNNLLTHFPNIILEVSHGGSTAIPNIPAKPTIDMFAVVQKLSVAENIRGELEGMGYHYRGEKGIPGRILFVKGPEEKRTHYLHLVERNNDEWKNHLLIKNYYLKYPEVALEYAELKKVLAKKHPDDRAAYRAGKDGFIKSVIKKAKEDDLQRHNY